MARQHAIRRGIRDNFSGIGEARRGEAGRGTVRFGLAWTGEDGRGNNAFRCAVTPGNF